MYGLSDKCPVSVDKLSSLLELILSLDFDSEHIHDGVRCGNLFYFSLHHLV